MKPVEIVRVYEDSGRRKGEYRALIDRLWPRGISRDQIDFDEWLKGVAPSSELRRWFGHESSRYLEFSKRYQQELSVEPACEFVDMLVGIAKRQPVILLTATRNLAESSALVLQEFLLGQK